MGARTWTTLDSRIRSSFVLAQMASMTDSASNSLLYKREMHSSRSTDAGVRNVSLGTLPIGCVAYKVAQAWWNEYSSRYKCRQGRVSGKVDKQVMLTG